MEKSRIEEHLSDIGNQFRGVNDDEPVGSVLNTFSHDILQVIIFEISPVRRIPIGGPPKRFYTTFWRCIVRKLHLRDRRSRFENARDEAKEAQIQNSGYISRKLRRKDTSFFGQSSR